MIARNSRAALGFVLVAALMVMSACATLGIPSLKSFNERMTGAYSSVTTVNITTTTLLNAKVISSMDAQNVRNQTRLAEDGLGIAKTLKGVEAEDKLAATIRVLDALEKYVAAKQRELK